MNRASNKILTAGVARVDITPPVGFRLQGIIRRVEPSVSVHMPLFATGIVLSDEQTKIAIFDCDLIGLDIPLANEIRQKIADKLGIGTSNVTVACTHTHNSPATNRLALGGPHDILPRPGEIEALDSYIRILVEKLVDAAVEADQSRIPVRFGSATGLADVNINREEMTDDGRVVVGRNPDGVSDSSVDVLRIDDLSGKALAILCSFAAHPVVMGIDSYMIGPDYPGFVRKRVEQITGATCVFLTGAAGNQATIEFLQDDWYEVDRIGTIIGCEVAKVATAIETRPHQIIRETENSMSSLALYKKKYINAPSHNIFDVASRCVTVPLQPLPSLKEATLQFKECEEQVSNTKSSDMQGRDLVHAHMMLRWSKNVMQTVLEGIKQPELKFEVVGYRLDDFVLISMPGEPFAEIGLAVKRNSKAKSTMFSGYGNGVLAYWPSADTVLNGGMAVEASVKTYDIPSPPTTKTVDIIVSEISLMLKSLGL